MVLSWKRLLTIILITIVGNAMVNLTFGWLNDQENALFDPSEMLRSFLTIFVILQGVHVINARIDTVITWENRPMHRLLLQILINTLWILISLNGFALFFTYIDSGDFFRFDEMIIINLIAVTLISLYSLGDLGFYFFRKWQKQRAFTLKKSESNGHIKTLPVKLGKKTIILPVQEIISLFTENKSTWLLTAEGKKLIYDFSLDETEKKLSHQEFFRANRQFIIRKCVVEKYSSASHGKLNVWIRKNEHLPELIAVSRLKAANFRKWMKG